jgi:hypothetical protein
VLRDGADGATADKSAYTVDLRLVENFVGNVVGASLEVEADLCYCGVFESINLISLLLSLICTSKRYIAAKRGIVTPWRL